MLGWLSLTATTPATAATGRQLPCTRELNDLARDSATRDNFGPPHPAELPRLTAALATRLEDARRRSSHCMSRFKELP